jgi:hypothetical protein
MIWYRRRDSNPHCLVSKTSASSRLGYTGIRISDFELRNADFACGHQWLIRNPNFAIRNVLADPARFERASSTFARSRSNSIELQARRISNLNCEIRIAGRPIAFESSKFAIRNPQFEILIWRKARESNPTRSMPPQFSRLLDSLYCRAFHVKLGRDARIRTEIFDFGDRRFTNCSYTPELISNSRLANCRFVFLVSTSSLSEGLLVR